MTTIRIVFEDPAPAPVVGDSREVVFMLSVLVKGEDDDNYRNMYDFDAVRPLRVKITNPLAASWGYAIANELEIVRLLLEVAISECQARVKNRQEIPEEIVLRTTGPRRTPPIRVEEARIKGYPKRSEHIQFEMDD